MIDRAENLLSRLMPAGVEHHELVSVLSSHFGGSVHDTERRVTLFPICPTSRPAAGVQPGASNRPGRSPRRH